MSTQPSTGGPIYFIRNIAYHAPGGSTRLTAGSPGVFFYNNTIVTETNGAASANVHWRNNLMLGENVQAAIFSVNTNTNYSSSDYNGFRPNPGNESFQWNSPPPNVAAVPADGSATLETRKFPTLEAYAQATKQDQHSVLLDYDIFTKVPKLDAKDLATVQRLYKAEDLDFRLRPGSAAVDRGIALPNITDGFTGSAPDLGALEFGQPVPIYGPGRASLAGITRHVRAGSPHLLTTVSMAAFSATAPAPSRALPQEDRTEPLAPVARRTACRARHPPM
jgi:hypothetical protein